MRDSAGTLASQPAIRKCFAFRDTCAAFRVSSLVIHSLMLYSSRPSLIIPCNRKYPYFLIHVKASLECGDLPPLSNTAEIASDDTPRVLKSEGKPSHSKNGAEIRQGFA
jgi:hypothetical protein